METDTFPTWKHGKAYLWAWYIQTWYKHENIQLAFRKWVFFVKDIPDKIWCLVFLPLKPMRIIAKQSTIRNPQWQHVTTSCLFNSQIWPSNNVHGSLDSLHSNTPLPEKNTGNPSTPEWPTSPASHWTSQSIPWNTSRQTLTSKPLSCLEF